MKNKSKQVFLAAVMSLLLVSPVTAEENEITKVDGPGGYAITGLERGKHLQLGGYFDTEFIKEENASTFRNHRLVLEAASQLNETLLFNTELEFEYGGNIIKVEQAWVDYRFSDAFVQRTGIIIVPFGRVNVLHDSDVRDATNKSIYSSKIVPSTWMDTGAGFHGIVDIKDVQVNYNAYMVNGLRHDDDTKIDNKNGIRKARDYDDSLKKDNNKNKAIVGRVGVSPMLGLEIGTSYYSGKVDVEDTKKLQMVGLDGFYKKGKLELIGEWAQNTLDKIDDSTPEKMSGYYLEARYHIPANFLKSTFIGKNLKRPVFTAFGRTSGVDTNADVEDEYDITQYTIGLNFRPVEQVVYKVEYEINQEKKNETDNNKIVASVAFGF